MIFSIGYFPYWKISFSILESHSFLFDVKKENIICQNSTFMENKKTLKLTDFQKNEENPFMKQAIEGIENHVVKKYKSSTGS